MIKATINGKEITVYRSMSILDAAQENGIDIPHFCDHPVLEKFGGCRMCIVEIEKAHKLMASCTTAIREGMVIHTESPKVVEARKAVMEFLLINHPLDCPTCDKAGECDLQDFSVMYGAPLGRFEERKRTEPESLADPLIVRNMERCIMCTRCVRMCDGVQGASALAVVGKSRETFIEPFSGGPFNCDYCGNCITVCPVGSLMSKLHRHTYRPWETEKTVISTCPFCGVGCQLKVQAREDALQRTMPVVDAPVNRGILCGRGYFGYEYIASPRRLTTPLIRKEGKLTAVSWEEAIALISRKLRTLRNEKGADAIAGIASARATNEDNYAFQKFMRTVIGTNHIDSIARLGLAGARRFIDSLLGPGSTANLIEGVAKSDAVLVLGGDPTREVPVLGIRVRNAHRSGAHVITLGHTPGLERHRTQALAQDVTSTGQVLSALLREVMAQIPLSGENKIIERDINHLTLDEYSDDEATRAAEALIGAQSVSFIVGNALLTQPDGVRSLLLVCALAYLLHARILLSSERPNENGLLDMGCEPDMLPGGVPLSSEAGREAVRAIWRQPIPEHPGKTLMEIIESIDSGGIHGLYVMGENPAFNLPDSGYVRQALKKLDFLVVQDIFMTETTELAHVVLPANAWAERDGTYTNLERRIQRVARAIKGRGLSDWRIISRIAGHMNARGLDWDSAEDIMAEYATLPGLTGGLTSGAISEGHTLWPYLAKPFVSTAQNVPEINRHYGPAAASKSNGNIRLFLERSLHHSGSMTRNCDALSGVAKSPAARMNAETAALLGVADAERITITTAQGSIALRVEISASAAGKSIFLTNHLKSTGFMNIVGYNIEPCTKTPYYVITDTNIQRGP